MTSTADTSIARMLSNGYDDLRWFEANLDRLKAEYDERFVALSDRRILDSDADLDGLLARLDQKGVDLSNVLIKFVSKVKSVL